MRDFPLINELNLDVIEGARGCYVQAEVLEQLLSEGKPAYGCGNKNVGSLTYGPSANPKGFEISALVLNIKPIPQKQPDVKDTARDLQYFINNPSAWRHFDQGLSDKIEALVNQVLK